MKVVVIGGTGRVGSRVVSSLRQRGHQAVVASPSTGVDTFTGEGLAEALAGAQVVVDVTDAPQVADIAASEFFEVSGRNLLAAEGAAGVDHHVALSIVGASRLQESNYLRGKHLQEQLVRASQSPYTLVQATQLFESIGCLARRISRGSGTTVPTALTQPISGDDVSAVLTEAALVKPRWHVFEVAGPERMRMCDLVRRCVRRLGTGHGVASDPAAPYLGARIDDYSLLPAEGARIGALRFDSWLAMWSAGRVDAAYASDDAGVIGRP